MRPLRWGFLAAVLAFAWLGLRGRLDEVGEALRTTPLTGLLGALSLVLLGLVATGLLWLRLMTTLDERLPLLDGLSTFFVGQLGKYIPGSVWSIGAQADLARRHTIAVRVTVTAGLLFLGIHVGTAVLLGSLALLTGGLDSPWPAWVSWAALLVAVVGLAPTTVRLAGRVAAGQQIRFGWVDLVVVIGLMAVAWSAYAALTLLLPTTPWSHLPALGGAFAVAYAVGVVVVVAPAGVGAREAVFVLLLTPVVGVAPATALALTARLVHTCADALLAAVCWQLARAGQRARLTPGTRPTGQ
jgi:uncharacterized membrane protein YbhN (UPF0104 family)